jgi:MFS-type transporter involved in bile tolerance (Atg22 family)
MAANLALHAVGIAVLLLVLLVPSLGRGVDRRLTGHSRLGT